MNPMTWRCNPPGAQRGVALAIALVALVGVTVISIASLKTGLLELLMAGNEESRMNAFHQAANGLDAVAAIPENFALVGGVGYTTCTANYGLDGRSGDRGDCSAFNVTLPAGFDDADMEMAVSRIDPQDACPPAGMKTSCEYFSASSFSVRSNYDGTQHKAGRSVQTQGYMVLVPRIEQGRM